MLLLGYVLCDAYVMEAWNTPGPQHPKDLRAGCSGTPLSLPERYDLEFGADPPNGADGQPTPDHRRFPGEGFEPHSSRRRNYWDLLWRGFSGSSDQDDGAAERR